MDWSLAKQICVSLFCGTALPPFVRFRWLTELGLSCWIRLLRTKHRLLAIYGIFPLLWIDAQGHIRVEFLHLKTLSPTLTVPETRDHSTAPRSTTLKREKKASFYLLSIIVDFPECFFITFGLATVPFSRLVPRVSYGVSHSDPHCRLHFPHTPSWGGKTIPDIHRKLSQQTEKSRIRFNNTILAGPSDACGSIILLWKFVW